MTSKKKHSGLYCHYDIIYIAFLVLGHKTDLNFKSVLVQVIKVQSEHQSHDGRGCHPSDTENEEGEIGLASFFLNAVHFNASTLLKIVEIH